MWHMRRRVAATSALPSGQNVLSVVGTLVKIISLMLSRCHRGTASMCRPGLTADHGCWKSKPHSSRGAPVALHDRPAGPRPRAWSSPRLLPATRTVPTLPAWLTTAAPTAGAGGRKGKSGSGRIRLGGRRMAKATARVEKMRLGGSALFQGRRTPLGDARLGGWGERSCVLKNSVAGHFLPLYCRFASSNHLPVGGKKWLNPWHGDFFNGLAGYISLADAHAQATTNAVQRRITQ